MNTFLGILTLLLITALQGCSYAISPDVVRQADRDVTFKQLQADPDAHAGKTVILGGTIVSVQDRKNETVIEIAQKKLDYWGKPHRTDTIGGHFQVLHKGRLDAMLYAPGRDITVGGEVIGSRERPAAESSSSFLLLRDRELKIWPREKLTWDKPQWMDPLYDRTSPQGQYGY